MQTGTADAIVVLGRGVEDDGTLPRLARLRVARAAELYLRGVAPRIVMAGKCSLAVEGEPAITEAAAMANYAESSGVPRDALLLEERSRDTIGNAYFTRTIFLEPNGWRAIRVVTSDFHVPRSAWVFYKMLGRAYDVAFSAAPSDPTPDALIERAREESSISSFLLEWLGPIPDDDRSAVERLIWEEHPAYAASPTMPNERIQARVAELAAAHRRAHPGGLRGVRMRQRTVAQL